MGRHLISLPQDIEDFVAERVGSGSFDDAEAYVVDLIRRDREGRLAAMSELGAMMAEARSGGRSERSFREIVDEARDEYERRDRPAAE